MWNFNVNPSHSFIYMLLIKINETFQDFYRVISLTDKFYADYSKICNNLEASLGSVRWNAKFSSAWKNVMIDDASNYYDFRIIA